MPAAHPDTAIRAGVCRRQGMLMVTSFIRLEAFTMGEQFGGVAGAVLDGGLRSEWEVKTWVG